MNGDPTVPAREQGKSSARSTAPRGSTGTCEVPPAEEPAESAANKRQCERSYGPKKRDECATRAPAEEG